MTRIVLQRGHHWPGVVEVMQRDGNQITSSYNFITDVLEHRKSVPTFDLPAAEPDPCVLAEWVSLTF